MWSQLQVNTVFVTLALIIVYHEVLSLKVNPDQVFVSEGESFTFKCGPSNDSLEQISVFLNGNEPSQGIVTQINVTDGIVHYQYRNTTFEDDNTIIVCAAGSNQGTIDVTVFYGPIVTVNMTSFTIEEGRPLSIPLSVNANPQPDADSYVLHYQGVVISNVLVNSTVIEFSNISRDQTGEYSLQISNNISTTSYNFTIDVTYPPAFVNSYLPSQCILIGTNATYNCSAVSEVVGNPQPSVTANVTQSEMDSVQMAGDTVIINGIVNYSVTVICIADNGIEPVATATASMNFGRVPENIDTEKIKTVTGVSTIEITWEAPTISGCADNITYQGEVYLLDNNNALTLFNTTATMFTIENLCPGSQYMISLRAANELGVSQSSNVTVKTNETEIIITDLNATRDANSIIVTWDFTAAGVTSFNITVSHQRIVDDVPQESKYYSLSSDDRMKVLDLEVTSSYRITVTIVASCNPAVSTNKSKEVDAESIEGINGSGMMMSAVLKLIITMTIVVLIVVYMLQ